jgi:hypothetical protein
MSSAPRRHHSFEVPAGGGGDRRRADPSSSAAAAVVVLATLQRRRRRHAKVGVLRLLLLPWVRRIGIAACAARRLGVRGRGRLRDPEQQCRRRREEDPTSKMHRTASQQAFTKGKGDAPRGGESACLPHTKNERRLLRVGPRLPGSCCTPGWGSARSLHRRISSTLGAPANRGDVNDVTTLKLSVSSNYMFWCRGTSPLTQRQSTPPCPNAFGTSSHCSPSCSSLLTS